MKYIVFIGFYLAIASALPYELLEDEEGEQYYLVPLSRTRRSPQETKWKVDNSGVGVSHTQNVLNSNGHRLDGTASAAKFRGSSGLKPDQIGGRLDYNHQPSRTSAYVDAQHTRNWGTDVKAGVKHDFYRDKNFNVGAGADYGRHYGGPFGNGKPQYGVSLGAQYNF